VHKIEFKFEPRTHSISQNVAMGSSILVVLLLLGIIGYTYKTQKTEIKEE